MSEQTGRPGQVVPYAAAAPPDLSARLRYAQALAESGLLPPAYRRQPANVLVALELGDALGLRAAAALYELHVVDGRPTPSARLAAALVRRAGHRFRVRGDETQAVAEVIRRDDPDFTWRATWTLARATRAGLVDRDAWRRYPEAMLKARASLEVARDACPECLAAIPIAEGASMFTTTTGGDWQDDLEPTAGEPDDPAAYTNEVEPITAGQSRAMHARLGAAGIVDRDRRLEFVTDTIGRPVTTSADLTRAEAGAVLDRLDQLTNPDPDLPPAGPDRPPPEPDTTTNGD